ncbi:DUF2760 domain-containing protein [Desulfosarcina ovata]|nr:DUF2760 domain-containing protein [Desulfosarcina ovata]
MPSTPTKRVKTEMNVSSVLKSYYRRSFLLSLVFSLLLSVVGACFLWQYQKLGTSIDIQDYAYVFVFIIFFGVLQWLFQKNILARLAFTKLEPATRKKPEKSAAPAPKESEADHNKRKSHEKRLFVHLFSVLQREGRLMDFFQEDLSLYEDGQIGAAVRGIHENCRKTVERYLKPEPVMSQAEGETVEIDAGFDAHAIKLVGNVVGEPPFKGVLRHRGWQLRTFALPDLSEVENPNIIAPAEVEVQ